MKEGAKRALKWVGGTVAAVALLLAVDFLPALRLETPGMQVLHGQWVDVYYETERAAAEDVFRYADAETAAVAEKLGFTEKQDVKVYIYDHQSTMQRKKYGFIGAWLGLDWYIGDNIGTNVILTSPANPGPVHDYDNNKYAVLHEIVHAYISVRAPRVHLWLTEGTALYLTNGEPFDPSYLEYVPIPSYRDLGTRSPLRFEDCGGYLFAGTYIEYLEKAYGWDRVLELLETEDYEKCLGVTRREVYDGWAESLWHCGQEEN